MTALLLQTVLVPWATAGVIATQSLTPGVTASTINAYQHTGSNIQIATQKVNPLDRWISGLIQKESDGDERMKILDRNGLYSYGCLQFQLETFTSYGLRYDLISQEDAEDSDKIEEMIFNCSLQKKLAKLMITENSNNWKHWYTSVITRKLGLPPREVAQSAQGN